ncbi:unnamed protein product [Symbiodinium sp. CCMP2592]|nr:unnamed protein product [Symbiodinium sp. CCMP2592]
MWEHVGMWRKLSAQVFGDTALLPLLCHFAMDTSSEEELQRRAPESPAGWGPGRVKVGVVALSLLILALLALRATSPGGGSVTKAETAGGIRAFLDGNKGTMSVGNAVQGNQYVTKTVSTVTNHDGTVLGVGSSGQIKPCEGSSNDGHGAGVASVVCCMGADGQKVGCDHASSGQHPASQVSQDSSDSATVRKAS